MNKKPATHTVTNPIDENEFFQRKSPRVYTHAIVVIDTRTQTDIDDLIKAIAANEGHLAKAKADLAAAPEKGSGGWDEAERKYTPVVFGKDHYERWAERLENSIADQYDRLADYRRELEAGKRNAWCAGWSQSEVNARKASARWERAGREIRIIPCRRSGTGLITSA